MWRGTPDGKMGTVTIFGAEALVARYGRGALEARGTALLGQGCCACMERSTCESYSRWLGRAYACGGYACDMMSHDIHIMLTCKRDSSRNTSVSELQKEPILYVEELIKYLETY